MRRGVRVQLFLNQYQVKEEEKETLEKKKKKRVNHIGHNDLK